MQKYIKQINSLKLKSKKTFTLLAYNKTLDEYRSIV